MINETAVQAAVQTLTKGGYKKVAANLQAAFEAAIASEFGQVPTTLGATFTLRELREAYEAETGKTIALNTLVEKLAGKFVWTGEQTNGLIGRPAKLYTRA